MEPVTTAPDTSRLDSLIQGQGEVLQMITAGKPLVYILEKIIRWVENQSMEELVASILLMDKDGRHLMNGAAPSLPAAYNKAINGITIGPNVGSCGTAAYTKKTIIVEDIQTDPLWEEFRPLARQYNLQACWSSPLVNSEGKVRGTFAIYYRTPRKPSKEDLYIIALVSQLALLAIEFRLIEEEREKTAEREKRMFRTLAENERKFRNLLMQAPVGICIVKGTNPLVEVVNDNFLELVGRKRAELEHKLYWEVLEEAAPYYAPVLKGVFDSGKAYKGEEAEVALIRHGRLETVYINFVYDPIVEEDGSVESVMILAIEVTEQVMARKRVEQSEQEVRSLVESAPFPIGVFVGKEMRIQLANQSMIEAWGKGNDVVGKLYPELLPELDKKILDQLNGVYNTGIPFHAQNQRVDLVVDGKLQVFYFTYSFTPLFDGNGKVYGVMNTGANVTELNLAHQKIKESEKNLRNMVLQAPVAICILKGPDQVVEIANPQMIEFWGKPIEEVLNRPVFDVLPEARGQGFEEILKNVYNTGETFSTYGAPVLLERKGRMEKVYVSFVYQALREGNGSISGMMGVAIEVTEQVRATKNIEEAEERARLAVDSAELGTFEVNIATNEVVCSPRMAAIFDVPVDADRTEYTNVIYPEDKTIRDEAYRKSFETGILDYDGRVNWKDGSVHWVRVKGRVYKDDNNNPVRLLGVVQDITEQKTFASELTNLVRERTSELEKKNSELERSNRQLEEFAHAASHDLKEPIRKIHFFTDKLKKQLSDRISEDDCKVFEKIENASVRMNSLIQDLLQYSYVAQKPMEMEEVDLNEKLKKVLEDLELEIEQKDAIISTSVLPVVKGYRRQLQQLFQNLISNALKYHKTGEVPEIAIRASVKNAAEVKEALPGFVTSSDSYHVIEVKDKGIGFEKEHTEKIFQMFQRLHKKGEYQGTGVGLAIAKKVMENHHGIIQAKGEKGKGATFKVYLPAL